MKTLHTQETLSTSTLTVITNIANRLQSQLGYKITNRFATKPAAIKKVLGLQAEIKLANPEEPDVDLVEPLTTETNLKKAVVKPVTPKKSSAKLADDTVLKLTGKTAKEGTGRAVVLNAFTNETATVKEVITYFLANFEQKRGLSEVNEGFAKGYINGSLRKGFLAVAVEK